MSEEQLGIDLGQGTESLEQELPKLACLRRDCPSAIFDGTDTAARCT